MNTKTLLTTIAATFVAAICLNAADDRVLLHTLPCDTSVVSGKLDNGLSYYIRKNALPKERCEFYLATNVGAIQETPAQDGLAHFLEHMCFNGLKNLPGKQMLEYLQHIGAEFGRNINAGTGVEYTKYMLNNIPVIREGIVDTCLLIMHDYSHFVVNDPKEIDAERGVILEEKRTRNDASWRLFEKSLPYYYGESKYGKCTLIGSAENLSSFKPQDLVDFYQSWYRPDMQAVIVVGDIEPDKIVAKLKTLFADIPAPDKPTVKEMPEVPLNDSTLVGILTDPENSSTAVEFIWKLGKPDSREFNASAEGYKARLVKKIISLVMTERFSDITRKSDAPFLDASLGIGNLCQTCEVADGEVSCENSLVLPACEAFLTEVEKMRRYGFSDDEMERVKDKILKGLKNAAASASTRQNSVLVTPLINNFISGYPYLDPEQEKVLAEGMLKEIDAAYINGFIPGLFTGEHLTILYTGVDREGQVHPTRQQLLDVVEKVKKADIAPNVSKAVGDNFVEGLTLAGSPVVKQAEGLYGSTVLTLGNGLKVVLRESKTQKNKVIFNLRHQGGLSLIPDGDIASFDDDIVTCFNNNCGVYKYSGDDVIKMLSKHSVSVNPYIKDCTHGVNGSCASTDIETALQLMYLVWAYPRFDADEWAVGIKQLNAVLPNMVNNPSYILNEHIVKTLYDNNVRKLPLSGMTLAEASLETYAKWYKTLFAGVSGATLYIFGDFDSASVKTLVEKYAGSLPKGGKGMKCKAANVPTIAKVDKVDKFQTRMATPKVTVLQLYNAASKFSVQKAIDMSAAQFILRMIYTETLREKEGGTYGASVRFSLGYSPRGKATAQVCFDTNVEKQEKLASLAIEGVKGLAANGPTEEQLTRAKENARKNVPEQRLSNKYWMQAAIFSDDLGIDYDTEYEKAVNGISAEGIRKAVDDILRKGNAFEIVMLPL